MEHNSNNGLMINFRLTPRLIYYCNFEDVPWSISCHCAGTLKEFILPPYEHAIVNEIEGSIIIMSSDEYEIYNVLNV